MDAAASEPLELDEALKRYGGYRRWNLLAFCLLGVFVFMPLCWQNLAIVFVGWEMPHHCTVPVGTWPNQSIPTDDAGELSQCQLYKNGTNETEACDEWTYYGGDYITIVNEFDLVCDYNYLSEMSQSIFQVGCLFAEIITSYLSDKFGRKKMFIVSQLGCALFGCLAAFSPSFIVFTALRTVSGMFVVAVTLSGVLLMLEIFDSDRRAFAGIGLEFLWLLAYYWLPLLAWTIVNWRHFQFVVSVVSALGIIFIWIMIESPEWLTAYDKYEEAEQALMKMARWNGVSPKSIKLKRGDDTLLGENKQKSKADDASSGVGVKVPVWELVLDPKMRKHAFISSILWFSNCMVYYGLILATPNMGTDRFISFLLSGIAELPAYIVAMLVVDRIGRRIPTFVFHIIAGIPLALAPFIPEKTATGTDLWWLMLAVALVAKFGITGSFAVMFLLSREVFPTNTRGTATGIFNVTGRIGSMIAPFMAYLAKISFWLPSVIFGIVALISGISSLFLPETAKKPMPMNLEEMHKIYYPKYYAANYPKDKSPPPDYEEVIIGYTSNV